MSGTTSTTKPPIFPRLKAACVPLLGAASISPSNVPSISRLLTELIGVIRDHRSTGGILSLSLVNYIFVPLSSILQRNELSVIPDQILEKIFIALALICEDWWWEIEVAAWEQIFMLCGGVIGQISSGKGKGKQRDDETKEAATRCLFSLIRFRTIEEAEHHLHDVPTRQDDFQQQTQTAKFTPILGHTLDSLLTLTGSSRLSLQKVSLEVLFLLADFYAPDDLLPSILPGVVSSMSRLALGSGAHKSWTNGVIVAGALKLTQTVIIRSIGDAICTREGAITIIEDLDDFADITNKDTLPQPSPGRPYATLRTSSWLRGTSSQLHIALNSLTPLVKHPTPSSLTALSQLASSLISATHLTLPQSQTLLLTFLLTLSVSDYESVSKTARTALLFLFSKGSTIHVPLLRNLMHITRDNLTALPRLLSSRADSKVEHVVGMIEAASRLGAPGAKEETISYVSQEIGRLLGPAGGIEKWGWSLLSVLEFDVPMMTATHASPAQLMLENDASLPQWVSFPDVSLTNVSTRNTYNAVVRMLRSLGHAAGDRCISSIEWFANVGYRGVGARSVAAMWCASRLLEGVFGTTLDSETGLDAVSYSRSKALESFAKDLARGVAQLWDNSSQDETMADISASQTSDEPELNILHVSGVDSVAETLRIVSSSSVKKPKTNLQPFLHKAMSLQLLAVTSAILQGRFTPLLIYALYPVFHSLVSLDSHLSLTALATLHYITLTTSYATPANLLMSNFDYALDAVSRRLTRRWLDIDATKVLVTMIHIVGNDVVERAGDVVEECFDRLDEYHGYQVIVEGLIEVLAEVIKVIEVEVQVIGTKATTPPLDPIQKDKNLFEAFLQSVGSKNDPVSEIPSADDLGPTPREAWGKGKAKNLDDKSENDDPEQPDTMEEPPLTPPQALTKQIVSRSMYFLTHGSAVIRARILTLLRTSVPVLTEAALLPSIHSVWPFILNRLSDTETFVVSAAVSLVEGLVTHMGEFMYQRVWDDVWPKFSIMLGQLEKADETSALARRGKGAVGTESAYTHSHRVYSSLLKTMVAAVKQVEPKDSSVWQVLLLFRRFLHSQAHEELQNSARDLYLAIAKNNPDAGWLVLSATGGDVGPTTKWLRETKWDIQQNVEIIMQNME